MSTVSEHDKQRTIREACSERVLSNKSKIENRDVVM